MIHLRKRIAIESDICIIGSGISAAMVADKLARQRPNTSIVVVEAGDQVATGAVGTVGSAAAANPRR